MARLSENIRTKLSLEYNFSCCVCGQKWFFDIHHIKSIKKGGTNNPSNLVLLCPTCHRKADRGVYSMNQLRRLKKDYLKRIKQEVLNKTQLTKIQEIQIGKFIYNHCIAKKYPRENYVMLDSDELFFLVFDFIDIGLIVNPSDMKPLLVNNHELLELESLEVIITPFRMMFLKEWQRYEEEISKQYYLLRLDVVELVDSLSKSQNTDSNWTNEELILIKSYQEDMWKLIHN